MTAETGPCGLWPDDIGPTYDLLHCDEPPYWNHGCATQRNLAAQVDNPADLVQPRAETPALAVAPHHRASTSTARATARRRSYPDANKGKISDVGQ